MATVKEFCVFWQISPETFRKYRRQAEELAGKTLVERKGSKTWEIVDEDLILAQLPEETKARALNNPVKEAMEEIIDAEYEQNETAESQASTDPMASLLNGAAIVPARGSNIQSLNTAPRRSNDNIQALNGRLAVQREETLKLKETIETLTKYASSNIALYRSQLDQESAELKAQVDELEEAQTRLEVQQKLAREAEIRNEAQRQMLEAQKRQMAQKVVEVRDFLTDMSFGESPS